MVANIESDQGEVAVCYGRLEAIKDIPTLPLVIQKLYRAIHDPKSDAQRVSNIIEDDPAIMARVLRVVNSAYYAGRDPIDSVKMAVPRMGMAAIYNIAMATSVLSAFGKGGEEFNRAEFWRHSICTGIAAAVVNRRCKDSHARPFTKDLLHLAGLLHDIGKIIFDQFFHEEFLRALARARAGKIPLRDAEKQIIGIDHTDAGGWLAMKWYMAPELRQVIAWHHDLSRVDSQGRKLVALVQVANYICNTCGVGDGGDPAPVCAPVEFDSIGLAVSDIPEIVAEVNAEAAKSEIIASI